MYTYTYIYMYRDRYNYIILYIVLMSHSSTSRPCTGRAWRCPRRPPPLRGWRNVVEIVLLEISNSIRPYPLLFYAYTGKSKPAIGYMFWID